MKSERAHMSPVKTMNQVNQVNSTSRMALALLCLLVLAPPASAADRLDEVLASMSAAGEKLKTMSASFRQTNHDYILSEDEVVTGKLFLRMPSDIRWEYEPPQEKVLLVGRNRVRLYNPTARQVQEFERGKLRGAGAELLVGFGRNESLKENYDVSLLAETEERVSLKLVPKPSSGSLFTAIELTLDKGHWTPVKTIFFEANRDQTELLFDAVKLNTELPKDIFELHLPPGVEIVRGGL